MILTSPEVELIRYTPDPEQALAEAYAVCRLKEPDLERVKRCIRQGHLSPLEHVVYTFRLKVSRACWSQIQEYRTASHTAQSHRYWMPNKEKGEKWDFIISRETNSILSKNFVESPVVDYVLLYDELLDLGVPSEEARMFLPMCTAIIVIWTQDLRNLLHFWQERDSKEVQWEIREVARRTRELVMETVPNLKEALEGVIG